VSGIRTAYGQLGFKTILPLSYVAVCVLGLFLATLFLTGCNLVPNAPDGVFALYRDRMKSGNLEQARALLSEDSLKLVSGLTSDYKLREPPENMALLNALDPGSPPTVLKTTDSLALLNARTLKGGSRMVRLVRANAEAPWKVDISEELSAFQSFLQTQQALNMMREQAGEYAASWKAFNDRLSQMSVAEPPAPPPEATKAMPMKPPHKKEIPKGKQARRIDKKNR
jgi:hypothetical protein